MHTLRLVAETVTRRIDEIGDESRRRILDAAEKLFAEKGFERTSFVDIARESGISRGSIPWHFKSKDGLLIAVVDRLTQRSMRTGEIDPADLSMPVLVEMYGEFVRTSGSRAIFTLLSQALHTEARVHEQYVAYLAKQRTDIWHLLMFHGVKDRARAEALAGMIGSALIGAHLQWQVDPDGFDLDAALDALATTLDRELDAERSAPAKRTARKASRTATVSARRASG